MKRKKLFITLLILTVVFIIFAMVGKKKGWFGNSLVFKVTVEQAENRKIIETITANGKIQPETEVKISSDVSGEIVEMYITDGQMVKKGDLLLKINPDIYLSTIDRMVASLNQAKANLANSKARQSQIEAQFKNTETSYQRSKKLWEQKAISDAEYQSSLAAYEVGKADIEAAKETVNAAEFTVQSAAAALQEGNDNLQKTAIYAPVDGTVSMLNVEKGERVVGTMQMPGTEMLRIANLDIMEVKVDVNENDIVRVSLGDTAIIEVDAYLGEKFKGLVTEIANSANTAGFSTDQVTSFDVKIRILSASYKHIIPADKENYYPFRPGMSATVDIQTKVVDNILSIPIQAVTTRLEKDTVHYKSQRAPMESDPVEMSDSEGESNEDEEMLEVVFVCNGKTVTIKEVETGIQDDNYIQIIKGILPTDNVVTAPYSAISKKLKNGMEVEIVKKEELFGGKE